MPEPYYAIESGNNCTQKLSDSPQNPEAPNEATSYVLLFFLWYWALACSDSTIDALITQRSKLEPDEKRGTLISCARISRQLGSMFAYLAVGILFNTVNYGGSFCGFEFKFNHFTWILFVFTIVGLIYALMFTNEKDIDKEKEKIEVKRKLAELWSLFHKWYYLKLLIFAVYISLISSIRVSKAKKQKLLKSGADLRGGGGDAFSGIRPIADPRSNTNLNLTQISPSLNRSSAYWFSRVSSWSLSRRRTTVFKVVFKLFWYWNYK